MYLFIRSNQACQALKKNYAARFSNRSENFHKHFCARRICHKSAATFAQTKRRLSISSGKRAITVGARSFRKIKKSSLKKTQLVSPKTRKTLGFPKRLKGFRLILREAIVFANLFDVKSVTNMFSDKKDDEIRSGKSINDYILFCRWI